MMSKAAERNVTWFCMNVLVVGVLWNLLWIPESNPFRMVGQGCIILAFITWFALGLLAKKSLYIWGVLLTAGGGSLLGLEKLFVTRVTEPIHVVSELAWVIGIILILVRVIVSVKERNDSDSATPFERIWIMVACSIALGWQSLSFYCTSRENLKRDYEEVFATPFEKVNVIEYVNARAGHGKRFEMSIKSTSPLQLRTPKLFRGISFDSPEADYYPLSMLPRQHPDWPRTCLYNEQIRPGPIWVYFNQSRDMCKVLAGVPQRWATMINGKQLHRYLTPTETLFFSQSSVYDEAAKTKEHVENRNRIVEWWRPPINGNAVSITTFVDPRLYQTPGAFERKLLSLLDEVYAYDGNRQKECSVIKGKVLEVEIPDSSLSEEQVEILKKLGNQLLYNNARLPAGKLPCVLRITVPVREP